MGVALEMVPTSGGMLGSGNPGIAEQTRDNTIEQSLSC